MHAISRKAAGVAKRHMRQTSGQKAVGSSRIISRAMFCLEKGHPSVFLVEKLPVSCKGQVTSAYDCPVHG